MQGGAAQSCLVYCTRRCPLHSSCAGMRGLKTVSPPGQKRKSGSARTRDRSRRTRHLVLRQAELEDGGTLPVPGSCPCVATEHEQEDTVHSGSGYITQHSRLWGKSMILGGPHLIRQVLKRDGSLSRKRDSTLQKSHCWL